MLVAIVAIICVENIIIDFKNEKEKLFMTIVLLVVLVQYIVKVLTTISKHTSILELLHHCNSLDEKQLFCLIKREKRLKIISRVLILATAFSIMMSFMALGIFTYIFSFFATGPSMPWIIAIQFPGKE